MLQIDEWFAVGERVEVLAASSQDRPSAAQTFKLSCRVEGAGPWLTLLHGFPTCSWDWVKIVNPLKARYRLLMFDFLGFGDSDKPSGHDYSLFEQADYTEALWRHFDVEKTGLVAHDYGTTVALELLSRQAEGQLTVQIEKAVLMNGGLYVDQIRPVPAQRLLQTPALGALLSQFIGERIFNHQFASVFSKAHPISASELRQHLFQVQVGHNQHAARRPPQLPQTHPLPDGAPAARIPLGEHTGEFSGPDSLSMGVGGSGLGPADCGPHPPA